MAMPFPPIRKLKIELYFQQISRVRLTNDFIHICSSQIHRDQNFGLNELAAVQDVRNEYNLQDITDEPPASSSSSSSSAAASGASNDRGNFHCSATISLQKLFAILHTQFLYIYIYTRQINKKVCVYPVSHRSIKMN